MKRTNMLIQLVLDAEKGNPKMHLKNTRTRNNIEPRGTTLLCNFSLLATRKMFLDSLQNGSSNTIGIILALLF